MTNYNDTPETVFGDAADAALDAQLAMLARVDGLAMPEGLEAALAVTSAAAARTAAPALRLAGQPAVHASSPRAARAQRWRVAGTRLAAAVALVLVLGLASVAKREGVNTIRSSGTSVATTKGSDATGTTREASDWAVVTAVLGETPANDMRDLWSDTASLDERIKSGPSSSDLLTAEGSL